MNIPRQSLKAIQAACLHLVKVASQLTFGHLTIGDATAQIAQLAETIRQLTLDAAP